jgi:hypothetical protein
MRPRGGMLGEEAKYFFFFFENKLFLFFNANIHFEKKNVFDVFSRQSRNKNPKRTPKTTIRSLRQGDTYRKMSDRSDSDDDNAEKPVVIVPSPEKSDGKARKRSEPDKAEKPSKRKKAEEEAPMVFLANKSAKPSDALFFAKTMNVKDFCSVLVGLGNIPNLDYILIQFSPNGMTLYGKPPESPVVVMSFWHESMFQEYRCTETTKRWVHKERMENLRKKISKDVEYIEISSITEITSGLKFSGDRLYKTGGACNFSFNVFEWTRSEDPVDMSAVSYNWHVCTSSQKLKDNVEFIDDKSEFISLKLDNKLLVFEGISEAGLVAERISHETETTDSTTKFTSLFYKKYLKIITSTQTLHKSITISFNPDTNNDIYPVLFSYTLDQATPQSHFSAYILPFVN